MVNDSCNVRDRPLNNSSFYTFSLSCGHYIWRRGYGRQWRQHSTVSLGRSVAESLSWTGDTTSSSSDVRTERHQDACIHSGRRPRWNQPPLGKVEERAIRFRYFRISNIQDRVDALHIYGGERIHELIESLKDVPLTLPPTSGEQNEFDKIITKLDNHFIPMVNPDCARSKLDKMWQVKAE